MGIAVAVDGGCAVVGAGGVVAGDGVRVGGGAAAGDGAVVAADVAPDAVGGGCTDGVAVADGAVVDSGYVAILVWPLAVWVGVAGCPLARSSRGLRLGAPCLCPPLCVLPAPPLFVRLALPAEAILSAARPVACVNRCRQGVVILPRAVNRWLHPFSVTPSFTREMAIFEEQ